MDDDIDLPLSGESSPVSRRRLLKPAEPSTTSAAPEASATSRSRWNRKHVLGFVLLLGVVFIWVASGTLIQYIFENEENPKPFFLTYFSTSLFTLYLTGFAWIESWRKQVRDEFPQKWWKFFCIFDSAGSSRGAGAGSNSSMLVEDADADVENASLIGDAERVDSDNDGEPAAVGNRPATAAALDPLSLRRTIRISLELALMWFLLNYTYNTSLSKTSVTSNTIISTTSGFFTFLLCFAILRDPFSIVKILSVGLSFCGVYLIAVVDNTNSGNTTTTTTTSAATPFPSTSDVTMLAAIGDASSNESGVGDALALVSALCYGLYTTLLRLRIGSDDEDRVRMPILFGFIGLWNLVLLIPVFPVLHYTGIERFAWPSGRTLLMLTANGLVGTVLSDLLWAKTVLLTTPVVSTVGLTLTIPLAMLSDLAFHSLHFDPKYLLGTLLVLVGFAGVNVAEFVLANRWKEVHECCTPWMRRKGYTWRW